MGPFSIEQLRQIHEAGQLSTETMVWKEGMPGWVTASSIPDFTFLKPAPPSTPPSAPSGTSAAPAAEQTPPAPGKIKIKLKLKQEEAPKPAVQPQAAAAATGETSDTGNKPKLRMKAIDPTPAAPPPPSLLPLAGPLPPSGPVGGPKALAGMASGEEKPPRPPDPWWKKLLIRLFSSVVWAPLFLIAVGATVWIFQKNFPNVLWIVWWTAVLGVHGVISLFGLRGLDSTFRFLSLLLIVPPVMLLHPTIMGETDWRTVPAAQWFFAGFCFLYMLTIRIGFRAYLSWGAAIFACLTGFAVTGFCAAVGMGLWVPAGWSRLVADGSQVRLPPVLVRTLGLPPQLASNTGILRWKHDQQASEHPVEKAILKKLEGSSYLLTIHFVDSQFLGATAPVNEGALNFKKLAKTEWTVMFTKDETQELQMTSGKWKLADGKTVWDVTSGTLAFTSAGRLTPWVGAAKFQIKLADGKTKSVRGEIQLNVTFPGSSTEQAAPPPPKTPVKEATPSPQAGPAAAKTPAAQAESQTP